DGTGLTSQATATVTVADFVPGSLSGFVYIDSDNDGMRDSGEEGFEGVAITLSGTNSLGNAVSQQTTTASNGSYTYTGLAPGNYTISETQPTGSRNGIPIVDGKDTIGSQGGTIPANDQFSITLTEGTLGTNNNFAELLGRTLSGSIVVSQSLEDFGGLDLLLFPEGASMAVGTELAIVQSAGGRFDFTGVAPGTYRLLTTTPTFLLANSSNVFTASVTAAADSTSNLVTVRGREAAYISLRDISTAAPTQYAHVAVGASGQEWYSLGKGWEGFTDANFTVTNGGANLHIEVTNAAGETLAADVARNDSRIRLLGQKNGLDLVQLQASSTAFNLQAIAPANTNGASGEGSPVVAPIADASVVATVAPVVSMLTSPSSNASPEGEASSDDGGAVQIFQPVIGRPIQAPAPGEKLTTTTTSVPLQTPLIPPDLLAASTGHSVSIAAMPELSVVEDNTIADETRAALLVEVADEYGDPFRYGASGGSEFVPLEEELNEATEEAEVIPADLLDDLAAAVAIA
ncbi:MAG: hypothetical protein HYV60_02760, partial [Planctomycetia bacterium]|nr:hypothetical protein [Planctomycetia bacterium]